MRRGGICALVAVAALGCEEAAPLPRGELVLEVDTDVAVPELASRLRVDVYAMDGRWLDSRDVFLGNADEWPASFGLLHPDDEGGPVEALVRAATRRARRGTISASATQRRSRSSRSSRRAAKKSCAPIRRCSRSAGP